MRISKFEYSKKSFDMQILTKYCNAYLIWTMKYNIVIFEKKETLLKNCLYAIQKKKCSVKIFVLRENFSVLDKKS